ncbi:MAG: type II toxin-antitoxin system RelB/DinJ family antitoxin [Moraxella osloensis]|nr:type II toxin-antitoxin system RelB/DinJ family antitoxin [Moraxella osloensis]
MSLDATVRARIDSSLKNEVEHIFQELGLSTSQAITIFLKKVKQERGLPFELKLPNEATKQAIQEARDEAQGEILTLQALQEEVSQCSR